MMEQPMDSKEHNNAVEETKPKATSPTHEPDPYPKPEVGALKPVEDNADSNTTLNIHLNQRSNNCAAEENDSLSSPAASLISKKSVRLDMESSVQRNSDHGSSNPYVNHSLAPTANSSSFNFQDTMGSVKDVLGRWGKKVGEATRMAEDLAGNTWQHCDLCRNHGKREELNIFIYNPTRGPFLWRKNTSASLADAALGRIAQGTKIIAEGGYEKVFRQTFETVPEEQLTNSFACYLSTSAGPVMGVLYVSTAKLAFCSDNPLSYQAGDKTEWSYYKVVIPLHQLKAINPSTSRTNSAEKYIQVISVDNHEFWYMGFLNYGGAVTCLQETLQAQSV